MPILFQSRVGSVVMIDDPAAQCSTQLLGLDPDIQFATERSIVTRVTVSQQVNVQFLHSLGALVYVYVFGDRMGQVTLSGLSFACDCATGTELGAELMLNWYARYRASRRRLPVRVTIGKTVFEGFVVGMVHDAVDPSLSLVQWNLSLATLPDDEGDAAAAAQAAATVGAAALGGLPALVGPVATGGGGGGAVNSRPAGSLIL